MMITGPTPCYSDHQNHSIFGVSDHDILSSSLDPATSSSNPTSFLYNLSLLKDKILQVQSLATIAFDHTHHHESTPIALPTMATLIQEIVVTASSMMFACQQMSLGTSQAASTAGGGQHDGGGAAVERTSSRFFINHQDTVDQWYGDGYNRDLGEDHNHGSSRTEGVCEKASEKIGRNIEGVSMNNMQDIVELEAADLLAKYTHYCQVCGKGFKRDANLRMHMRAHGDEYKSSAALSNPTKVAQSVSREKRKYSCPQEGCRWNKNHAKFQPLKSMICVKNHYKRSHCPKMYVCKRCNTKQFSVLSDLRTHEKHCGDLKWLCSCGTTFSRKDKLMGHVALFVGHTPVINSSTKTANNGARNMH